MLHTIGVTRWPEVRELYHALVLSRSNKVKQTLACSLHEVARILGDPQSGMHVYLFLICKAVCQLYTFLSSTRYSLLADIGGTSLVETELIPVFESMLQVRHS